MILVSDLWLEVSAELQPEEAHSDSRQQVPEMQSMQSIIPGQSSPQGACAAETQPGDITSCFSGHWSNMIINAFVLQGIQNEKTKVQVDSDRAILVDSEAAEQKVDTDKHIPFHNRYRLHKKASIYSKDCFISK